MRLLLLCAALVCVCVAQQPPASCTEGGSVSNLPISDAGQMTLVKTVPNGKLYTAGPPGNTFRVAHLYGSAAEMGLAHGQLSQDIADDLFKDFFEWVYGQIDPYIKFLPKFLREAIETGGVSAGLALTADLTRKYTDQRWFDEIGGFAKGSGVEYTKVLQLQMFPELIKASCSIYGAWGEATANSTGGLLQLRALDWGIDNPLYKYHQVTVYHPSDSNGHSFATLGFPGFLGALTGYSGLLGVSEKVWLHYDGKASRRGVPWHFLLRDILQFDSTLDDATNRMVNSRRTCSIFVGVGAKQSGQLRVFEYAHESINEFDDHNYPLYKEHERIDGVVYVDKHTQPDHNACMEDVMEQMYGKIDAPTTIHHLLSIMKTGDLHSAIYDFAADDMYIGLAGLPVPSVQPDAKADEVLPAYARPWAKLDMTAILNEKQ